MTRTGLGMMWVRFKAAWFEQEQGSPHPVGAEQRGTPSPPPGVSTPPRLSYAPDPRWVCVDGSLHNSLSEPRNSLWFFFTLHFYDGEKKTTHEIDMCANSLKNTQINICELVTELQSLTVCPSVCVCGCECHIRVVCVCLHMIYTQVSYVHKQSTYSFALQQPSNDVASLGRR